MQKFLLVMSAILLFGVATSVWADAGTPEDSMGLLSASGDVEPTNEQMNRQGRDKEKTIAEVKSRPGKGVRKDKSASFKFELSSGPQGGLAQRVKSAEFKRELADETTRETTTAKAAEDHFSAGERSFDRAAYGDAADDYQKSVDALPTMAGYLNLGISRLWISDFQGAEHALSSGLQIAQKKKNQQLEAACLMNLSVVCENRTELDASLRYSKGALQIYDNIGDGYGEAGVRANMGIVYRMQGDLDKALTFLNKALEIFQKKGFEHLLGKATTQANIAAVHASVGDLDKAVTLNEEALGIYDEIEHRLGQARTLENIGSIYAEWEMLDEAMAYHEQALTVFESTGNRLGQADALHGIGNIYLQQDKPREALKSYEKALTIFRGVGNRSGEANALYGISRVYLLRHRFQEAGKRIEEARTIFQDVGMEPPRFRPLKRKLSK